MPEAKPLAVVLLSGGMDSLLAAKLASREHRLALLHVNYGQRTEGAEQRAFKAIADWFGVTRALVVHTNFYKLIGASALTDERIAVPRGGGGNGIPITYVPFRNGLLLSMACAWAESLGAKKVIYGAVQVDAGGYPDCREAFVKAMNGAVKAGQKPESAVEIEAPLISLHKEDVVQIGLEQKVPFELTWSCYERNDIHCGLCDSCRLRHAGFEKAGKPDPTKYRPPHDPAEQRKVERLKTLLKALVPPGFKPGNRPAVKG